jgi:hypothetical protein
MLVPVATVLHEREEWLDGYQVAPGEGSAWWGGFTFPPFDDITNITWHYPGGSSQPDPGTELRTMQAAYHRRRDAGDNGRPFPFDKGYDLGYNAVIDLTGGVWKVRWTDKRCAANEKPANDFSFAVQFMTANKDDDITPAQLEAARWLDGELRSMFRRVPAGVAGHKGHRDFVGTACPGDLIYTKHVTAANLLARATPRVQGDDDDMRYKLYKPRGFFDVLAVGPGNPFNPGSPQAAQELVDLGQVADRSGNPVNPGTDFTLVRIEITVPLWTAMNAGKPPVATKPQ